MGKKTGLLRIIGCGVLCLTALLMGSTPPAPPMQVDANDYQQFWLWAAVKPQPVLHQAQVLYLHQGEMLCHLQQCAYQQQGQPISKLVFPHLWVVIRVTTLEIPDSVIEQSIARVEQWSTVGNSVLGLQIDFDAGSLQIAKYGAFLQKIRAKLPARYQLSVTGLLDWAKTGDIHKINALPINEVVIQSYQGRHTVTNYAAYLPALSALKVPFRIGLVQSGKWDTHWQRQLAQSPYYRGEVIFLVNE
jgi:hypothetical protein